MVANVIAWQRSPGEIAHRTILAQPVLRKTCDIVVEYGTQALFFKNGVFAQALEAGRYPARHWVDRLLLRETVSQIALVWVDCGTLLKNFDFAEVRTCDNIPLALFVQLSLCIDRPSLFCANVFKHRETFGEEDLCYWSEGVRNAAEEFFALCPISRVSAARAFKDEFEQKLREHLCHSLARDGLALKEVRAVRCHNPQVAALKDFSGEGEIDRLRRDEKVRQGRDVLRHYRDEAALELTREIIDVARYKKKAVLAAELKKIQDQEQLARREEEARLSISLKEIATREADLEKIWAEEKQDHELAREFWVENKKIQQRQALERLDIQHHLTFAQSRQNYELQMERSRREHEIEMERRRLAAKLQCQALSTVAEEQRRQREVQGEMERREYRVEMEAKIAAMAMETQKKRVEEALSLREKMDLMDYNKARYRLQLEAMQYALREQLRIEKEKDEEA